MFPFFRVPVCVCGAPLATSDFDGFFNADHNPDCSWAFMVIPPITEALEIDENEKINDSYRRGELITHLVSIYLYYRDLEDQCNEMVNEVRESVPLSAFDDNDIVF